MQPGRGGGRGGGGLVLIATFSLGPAFPIQADAVITRLALAFTVVTLGSFFPTFDLAVFAWPVGRLRSARIGTKSIRHPLTSSRCDSAFWARRFLVSWVEACSRADGVWGRRWFWWEEVLVPVGLQAKVALKVERGGKLQGGGVMSFGGVKVMSKVKDDEAWWGGWWSWRGARSFFFLRGQARWV